MSRYLIKALEAGRVVAVGWDHPLLTFYFQLYRADAEGKPIGSPIVWVGADRPRQLYDIEDLVRASRRYVELTPEMRARLYGDRDEGE